MCGRRPRDACIPRGHRTNASLGDRPLGYPTASSATPATVVTKLNTNSLP